MIKSWSWSLAFCRLWLQKTRVLNQQSRKPSGFHSYQFNWQIITLSLLLFFSKKCQLSLALSLALSQFCWPYVISFIFINTWYISPAVEFSSTSFPSGKLWQCSTSLGQGLSMPCPPPLMGSSLPARGQVTQLQISTSVSAFSDHFQYQLL